MLTVRSGDLNIAYRETGSGDPVFFVNGTGESSATWGPLWDRIAARARCVGVDLRDTGGSDRARAPYGPAELAADVAAVVNEIGAGPVHLIGFSLGGAVGQLLAIEQPGLLRSLTLLSTWGASDPWFVSQMRSWQSLRRAAGTDQAAFDRALEPWMFSPATMRDGSRLASIHAMWNDAPAQDVEAFCRQCDADAAHDAASKLGSIRTPTIVIVGEDDICTPPRYAHELAGAIEGSELVTIPDAGHCAVFERPDVVGDAIEAFLRRVS